jgi:glycosyltransferase involved in cell wall biosynthesis
MHILHVVPSFGLGGMEKIVCAVVESSAEKHKHVVLSLDGCACALNWIKHKNAQLIRYKKPQSRALFFRSLYSVLRRCQPDLLMTYNWGATDAIWLGRIAGIRNIIHSEHGFNIDEAAKTDKRRDVIRFCLYHFSSNVIVVSHELKEMMKHRFHLSEHKVRQIPNGIDTSYFSPNFAERERMRRSLEFTHKDVVLGFSGRLDPVKNLDLLLDIFAICKPCTNPFRLLIVGDGPEKHRIEARCHAEGLHAYVRFVGQQEEVRPYLRAMDVFLLTSLREQMPLTVLEAMGVGMPVIATRVGELPYVIDDGTDGFIRDVAAPVEQYLQPLRSLLCASQKTKLGNAARKKVIERFQLENMLQHYDRLIQEFDQWRMCNRIPDSR